MFFPQVHPMEINVTRCSSFCPEHHSYQTPTYTGYIYIMLIRVVIEFAKYDNKLC